MLFLVMGNSAIQETKLLRDALEGIAELLPASWELNERLDVRYGDTRLDAVLELTGPNGDRASFAVEVKRSGVVPTSLLLTALRDLQQRIGKPVLVVSDYVGPSLRAALVAEGISFADTTGWIRLVSNDPLILLTGQGADRSPRPRQTSAITRLNGIAASRTIRALAITELPVGVRTLAAAADVSPGSVSKLLVTLASEGIVDRDPSRAVSGCATSCPYPALDSRLLLRKVQSFCRLLHRTPRA